MADTAMVIGTLLAILGVWGYFGAEPDHRSLTAFIPTGFGLALIVLGVLARRDALRKHVMHAAAAIALVGFFVTAGRFLYKLFSDGNVANTAGLSTATMAALCAVFVVLCVKSFIQARRLRKASAQAPPPNS